jgi:hypothetical protein
MSSIQTTDTALVSTDVLATQIYMTRSNATADDYEDARRGLYKLGIKTFATDGRMIFSAQHACKTNLNNAYAQECNGLILELGSWNPIMVPPRGMRFNINTQESNKFLHQGLYNIYKAEDGTCINLYYFNGAWRISTSNGYQMNDVKRSGHSYQELVTECFETLSLTWDEVTESLNKKCCYSFGFRHKDLHRFNPKNRIWFIQSVNLDDTSEQYMWASDKSPLKSISCQEPYMSEVANLKDLYKLASTSINDYYYNNLDICYGFILRSNSLEATGQHSDLFIESSLMRFIRTTWYNHKLFNNNNTNIEYEEDRVTLAAYLDTNQYENFTQLFPQYSGRFYYYSNLVNMVVKQIIKINDCLDKTVEFDTEFDTDTNTDCFILPTDTDINRVANNLLINFNHNVKYKISDKTKYQKTRVFSEFVFHPCSLDILMGLLVHPLNE